MFLTIHAATVKHVTLIDIMGGEIKQQHEKAFESLALAFKSSKLTSLDLSRNVIGAYMWKCWASQTKLQRLILDFVHIDDSSMKEFAAHFAFGGSLEDLHVVLAATIGSIGINAANAFLKGCTKLHSLRWVNKNVTQDAKLPWYGLKQFACSKIQEKGSTLMHLVMEGSMLSDEELNENGLSGALINLPKLKTLKLRKVGLDDEAVKRVISPIRNNRPPLECLDLSYNDIQCKGAKAIATVSTVPTIMKQFGILILSDNKIASEGGMTILESFATRANVEIDLRLDRNPFDCGKVAFHMAIAKNRAEAERDQLLRQRERLLVETNDSQQSLRHTVSGQTGVFADMHILQQETMKLKEDRDALIKAFSVLGLGSKMDERKKMLDRIALLEEMVFGPRTPSSIRRTSMGEASSLHDRNLRTPTRILRSSSFEDSPSFRRTTSPSSPDISITASSVGERPNLARSGSSGRSLPRETRLKGRSTSFDDSNSSARSASESTSTPRDRHHQLFRNPNSFRGSSSYDIDSSSSHNRSNRASRAVPFDLHVDPNSAPRMMAGHSPIMMASPPKSARNAPSRTTADDWESLLDKQKLPAQSNRPLVASSKSLRYLDELTEVSKEESDSQGSQL